MIQRWCILILSVVMLIGMCFAAGEAIEFGRDGVGSRQEALGGAVTALDGDWNSAFWNPAGLATLNKFSIGINTRMYGIAQGGVTFLAPSIALPLGNNTSSKPSRQYRSRNRHGGYSFRYTEPRVELVQYRSYDDSYNNRRSDSDRDANNDRYSERSRDDDRRSSGDRYGNDADNRSSSSYRRNDSARYNDNRTGSYNRSRSSSRSRFQPAGGKVLAPGAIIRNVTIEDIQNERDVKANNSLFQISWGDTFRSLGADTGKDEFCYGLTVKMISANYDGRKGSAMSSDIGMLYKVHDAGMNIGALIRNLPLKKMTVADDTEADNLPFEYSFGMALDLIPQTAHQMNRFLLMADAGKAISDISFGFNIGAEFTINKIIALRVGSSPLQENKINFGIGADISGISVNYAGMTYGQLGLKHSIGVAYQFN